MWCTTRCLNRSSLGRFVTPLLLRSELCHRNWWSCKIPYTTPWRRLASPFFSWSQSLVNVPLLQSPFSPRLFRHTTFATPADVLRRQRSGLLASWIPLVANGNLRSGFPQCLALSAHSCEGPCSKRSITGHKCCWPWTLHPQHGGMSFAW